MILDEQTIIWKPQSIANQSTGSNSIDSCFKYTFNFEETENIHFQLKWSTLYTNMFMFISQQFSSEGF